MTMASDRKRRGFHPAASTAPRPAPAAEQSKTIVYQTLKGAVVVNEPEPLTLSGNASMEAFDRPTRGDEGEEPRSHTSTYRYARSHAQAQQQTEPLEEEIPTETRTQRAQRMRRTREAMAEAQQTVRRQARTAAPSQQQVERSYQPAPETNEDEAINLSELDTDIEQDLEEALRVRDRSYAYTERRERYNQAVSPDENPYAYKQRRVRQHQPLVVVPSLNRQERRHSMWTPVISVALTILGIAILWIGIYMVNAGLANWNLHWNNEASRVVYANFGHGKAGELSRVEVINDQGRIELLEITNGDLAHAKIVSGPDFSQAIGVQDPGNIPLRLEMRDVDGDGKLDVVVVSTSGNDMIGRPIEQSWVLYNTGTSFSNQRPHEQSSGQQQK